MLTSEQAAAPTRRFFTSESFTWRGALLRPHWLFQRAFTYFYLRRREETTIGLTFLREFKGIGRAAGI